jgi:BRCT domain type II-containing protein
VDVNLGGTTTVTNSSAQSTVTQEATSAVPEPSNAALIGIVIALTGELLFLKRSFTEKRLK